MGGQKPSKKNVKVKTVENLAQPAGFNSRMCILSVIGICFVVLGHLRTEATGFGTFFEWFPYYSFHMPLFLFITGYFFRDLGGRRDDDPARSSRTGGFWLSFLKFFWKKFKTLMIPYYVINGCMILFQLLLVGTSFWIFPVSFTDYLPMPWTMTQPLTFAIPTWYLAGLFIAQIMYALLRSAVMGLGKKILKKESAAEVLLLVITLVLGAAACYVVYFLQPSEIAIVYLRSVVMLFFIQAGRLYRSCLEKYDTMPSRWYFIIVFALQLILLLISQNSELNFGLYSLVGFGRTGFLYFCAGITGILLWLRISRILDEIRKPGRLVRFIGRNTKYIMAFHLLGFFALNLLLLLMYNLGFAANILGRFNPEELYADPFYYWYQGAGPRLIPLYFLAGMGVSLLLAWLIGLVKKRLKRS